MAQSAGEITGGLTEAAVTASTGVLAPAALGGLVAAGHGLGVGVAGTCNLNSALKELVKLGVVVNASEPLPPEKPTTAPSSSSNSQTSSSSSSAQTVKSKDLKLGHSEETITKSADYQKIKKLSDAELKESVLNPKPYNPVTINTKTGKLSDGNTRVYELQRRKIDVDIPVKKYTPDDSMFPNLKEPPRKS